MPSGVVGGVDCATARRGSKSSVEMVGRCIFFFYVACAMDRYDRGDTYMDRLDEVGR